MSSFSGLVIPDFLHLSNRTFRKKEWKNRVWSNYQRNNILSQIIHFSLQVSKIFWFSHQKYEIPFLKFQNKIYEEILKDEGKRKMENYFTIKTWKQESELWVLKKLGSVLLYSPNIFMKRERSGLCCHGSTI